MSGKGNCYDNAVVETFFKTIKSELIWRTVFMSRSQAETEFDKSVALEIWNEDEALAGIEEAIHIPAWPLRARDPKSHHDGAARLGG